MTRTIFDESLGDLLDRCAEFTDIDRDYIEEQAWIAVKERDHQASPALLALEKRWYDSLPTPDYGVYAEDNYIADLWGCWMIYSRKYLRNIQGANSLTRGHSVFDHIKDAALILDLGCGFGHTAAAWKTLIPEATVIGTNVTDTLQYTVAESIGREYGFDMEPEAPRCAADLVFASEYFEHFERPIEHLIAVVQTSAPRLFLTANAFGQRAIGHFINYRVGSRIVHGKQMGRVFTAAMGKLGYRRVKTKMWNQRPALWARVASPQYGFLK